MAVAVSCPACGPGALDRYLSLWLSAGRLCKRHFCFVRVEEGVEAVGGRYAHSDIAEGELEVIEDEGKEIFQLLCMVAGTATQDYVVSALDSIDGDASSIGYGGEEEKEVPF